MIHIKGIIGNEEGEVSLLNLIEQVQKEQSDTIYILIDSNGGDLEVGFSMYEYLLSLDKQVTTESVNNCASAATLPFIAGTIRIAGCPIMIHNPFIPQLAGDSEFLRIAADWVEEKEKKAEKIYSDRTKLNINTISELMRAETYLSPNQAVSLGFATQAKQIALARLDINPNTNKNESKMSKEQKSAGDIIREALGLKPKVKNEEPPKVLGMDLTTANGATLTVEREEGNPQVGDVASPDGSHPMPDGSVIVVEGGVITEIVEVQNTTDQEAENAADAAIEEMTSIIEDLKEELVQAKALAKTSDEIKILNAVRMAGGAEKVFQNFKGIYRPQARVENNSRMEPGNPLRDRINQIKDKGGK